MMIALAAIGIMLALIIVIGLALAGVYAVYSSSKYMGEKDDI